ncbi:hypothetical protein R3P38DRAFT_1040964 [Favolaschia claudopus]|uniref:Uncharacterized protein n=1 Tax=Favolaschia claudopus TaxID=2862362 RepID=A0AAW0BJK6_9AGAR
MSSPPDFDIEKKATHSGEIVTADVAPSRSEGAGHMHRTLKGRQVSMIAIAGTIGAGCALAFCFCSIILRLIIFLLVFLVVRCSSISFIF